MLECIDKDKNLYQYAYDLQTRQLLYWYAYDPNRQDAVLIRLQNKPNNNYTITPTAWATDCTNIYIIYQLTDHAYTPTID